MPKFLFTDNIFFMQLVIKQEKRLSEICKEFHKAFPFLKLGFKSRKHPMLQEPIMLLSESDTFTLADIRNATKEGVVQISGTMSVDTVEKKLADEYGLEVQVLRKAGEKWLVTTSTNDLSLQQQNTMGSLTVKKTKPEIREDYTLNDN